MEHCKICELGLINIRKLSKHVRDRHKDITIKNYYDTYLKLKFEGKCVICENPTNYSGLGIGYVKTCSNVCSGKLIRKNLKNDEDKNELFKQKVTENMKKIWKNRELTDEKKFIMDKVNEKKIMTVDLMSSEERKLKFGWLNNLSGKEKEDKIKELCSYLENFWENATEDQIKNVWDKRMHTILNNIKNNVLPKDIYSLSDLAISKINEIFYIKNKNE